MLVANKWPSSCEMRRCGFCARAEKKGPATMCGASHKSGSFAHVARENGAFQYKRHIGGTVTVAAVGKTPRLASAQHRQSIIDSIARSLISIVALLLPSLVGRLKNCRTMRKAAIVRRLRIGGGGAAAYMTN